MSRSAARSMAALLAVTALNACVSDAPEIAPVEPVLDGAVRDSITTRAQPVAGALMQTLSGQLVNAIQEGGPVAAVEFCNIQALSLTQQVSEEQGMRVFRTSRRLRNPNNAPDAAAQLALDWFEAQEERTGTMPDAHVQALPDGSHRYYQAIRIGEPCLGCHGAMDALAPGIPDVLQRLYPDDAAVGYSVGDWRGILGIHLPGDATDARTP